MKRVSSEQFEKSFVKEPKPILSERWERDLALRSTIFVFGSNLCGAHGAGAAKDATLWWGAQYGQGIGFNGNSYAIPTKDEHIETLPLYIIKFFVRRFLHAARMNPDFEFQVTAIGCGLAGYTPEQIAPLFRGAPENVHLPLGWSDIIKGSIVTTRFGKELPF